MNCVLWFVRFCILLSAFIGYCTEPYPYNQFNDCWVLVHQVTYHSKCSKVPYLSKCMHGHVWSWPLAHFQRWVSCKCSDRHKNVLVKYPSLSSRPEHTRVLSVSTDKSLKEWAQVNLGIVPWKLFAYVYWYGLFSLFWCWNLSALWMCHVYVQ